MRRRLGSVDRRPPRRALRGRPLRRCPTAGLVSGRVLAEGVASSFVGVRSPKNRGPFHFVPVIKSAISDRLENVFPSNKKPLSTTVIRTTLPFHSRIRTAPDLMRRGNSIRAVGFLLIKAMRWWSSRLVRDGRPPKASSWIAICERTTQEIRSKGAWRVGFVLDRISQGRQVQAICSGLASIKSST